MDSLGLLAAWVGIVSFLLCVITAAATELVGVPLQRWWATTSPERARRRIQDLYSGIGASDSPDTRYLADLIALFGAAILNLVAAGTVVVVSIEVLDLGPALLASTLPFSIDAKVLNRVTGLFLLFGSYFFVFRITSLAIRILNKTASRKAGYSRAALDEIACLREKHGLAARQAAGVAARE